MILAFKILKINRLLKLVLTDYFDSYFDYFEGCDNYTSF